MVIGRLDGCVLGGITPGEIGLRGNLAEVCFSQLEEIALFHSQKSPYSTHSLINKFAHYDFPRPPNHTNSTRTSKSTHVAIEACANPASKHSTHTRADHESPGGVEPSP